MIIFFSKMDITDNFDKSCLNKVCGTKPNGLCLGDARIIIMMLHLELFLRENASHYVYANKEA